MEENSSRGTPSGSEPSGGRLHGPRGWLAERGRTSENGSALAFGVRLVAAGALTLGLVGAVTYVVLDRNLAQRQIAEVAAIQRADAHSFESYGAPERSPRATSEIDRLVDAVASRPGTLEALLVSPQRVVIATNDDRLLRTRDGTPRIAATLTHGTSYAGRDTESMADRRNFEFVVPVYLSGNLYAYEMTYDHRAHDAQLHEVHMLLLLIGLFAAFGGSGLFYLVGGRRLVRDHLTSLHRATRDGLTDLSNHRAFQEEFPQAIGAAARYEEPLALVLLDVDDFKLVNDLQGHPHGDAVLKRVSEVLRDVRPGDRPYRIGGDEFALLLAHSDAAGAKVLTRRLCRNLADSGIKVSVGVSALRAGVPADTLRAEADAALYQAKRHGGNGSAHFDDLGEDLAVSTAATKEAVRRLTEEGRLTTDFQPIWDIGAGTLLGLEALARPDPSYGLSGPAEAFDIAEQIGRVHQLDVLCAESALKSAAQLKPGVLLFLNLSPVTLDLDADAVPWLAQAVERVGLSPQQVVIEVTERFGGRTAAVVKRLMHLRDQGFKIAVDDVGTGNSGLEMLRKIEAEFVKIDRSIVMAAATEPGARAVLMAMATFGRQTGAFVIAEGIEDEETLEFLRTIDDTRLDSDLVIQGGQGFGLGRPSSHLSLQPPDILRRDHPVSVPMRSSG